VLNAITRWAARKADAVVLVSERLAPALPDTKYEVIPVGIDLEMFKPQSREESRAALGWDPEDVVVLFGGDPSRPVKRYSLAKEAVERLPAQCDAKLVTMVGQMRSVVALYLNAADVLLLTSKHESGPTIVKEAVACGLPVVSVDVGDVREVIGGLSGCVVCEDDRVETITRGLTAVLDERRRIDGRPVAQQLDQRRLARRQVEVYEGVLRRFGP
jgi:glycosyltransferase involved in cell wall biosynthesis